ncbi:MAG: hypothetical protein WC214_05655 [Candidatus Omnitrophota bacterium]
MSTSLTMIAVGLVVAIIFIIIRKIQSNTETKELEIELELDNKHMANAEPWNYRCRICGKKFTDGGTFKAYKGKWHCINCYLWILNVKNESFIKKVKAHFLEERKKQAESEKAGKE